MALQTPAPRSQSSVTRQPVKKCSGPCGRRLSLTSFDSATGRKDGRRSDCKECRRARRGSQGKEGKQARALERELWVLRETYSTPALSDILSRALEEVRQVGAAKLTAEQLGVVRKVVLVGGCRSVEEVVEDTQLTQWTVRRALEKLTAEGVLETRNKFLLSDEAEEPGRSVTEYHPIDTPRGEVFSHILRRAVDDDLL
jgi:predicted transcriptional regulator